jgi:hypothetical protein
MRGCGGEGGALGGSRGGGGTGTGFQEEAAIAEEAACEAARAVARAEELAEEAAAEATAQEEMARDRRCWDDDMATARRAREVHELATQRRHRRNLARRQAHLRADVFGQQMVVWVGPLEMT